MSIRTAFTALALSLSLSPVFAADQTVSFGLDNTASFIGTDPILQGGDDVISFVGLTSGTYSFELTLSGLSINLTSLNINGTAGTVELNGKYLFADVSGTGTSPFQLTLVGTPTSAAANYSGQLAVTAVPEPTNVALLLAGLGLMGFVSKRRKI